MKVKTALSPIRAYRQGALLLALMVCLLIPSQLFAQANTLRVTLHDVGGVAIAGVSIIVRSEDGQELARQATGSDGTASFAELPSIVRVAVEGQARGGPRLYQLGDDAQGVRVVLAPGAMTLDLRAEPDGLVLPDPATMLSLEEGGPLVVDGSPIPSAAIATPAPLPTAPGTATTAGSAGDPESTAPPQANWVAPVTLLIVVAAACVLRLVQQLRSER